MMGKFDGIGVGDQIMRRCDLFYREGSHIKFTYYLVTDAWFDPVKGQRKTSSGEMVAVQQIDVAGDLVGSKYPHTRRGLASNGYALANCDYMKMCTARLASMKTGKVIGIGAGKKRKP